MFWGLFGKKQSAEVAWGISFDLVPDPNRSDSLLVTLQGRALPTEVDDLLQLLENGPTVNWTTESVRITGVIFVWKRNSLLYRIEKINESHAAQSATQPA